ncbi:hypothetical protein RYA05_02415 [Pseudomonas syringae pv. actinidiae]|nr:hypothetical protein [Pseudomonas syringae pv. actinidiae]
MENLLSYVNEHAEVSKSPLEGFEDLAFFHVRAGSGANASDFRALLDDEAASRGLNLFDHDEHSFIQIGAVLGDQGFALRVMGLGASLGMWQLLTPKSVLGIDNRSPDGAQIAGMGMVTVFVKRPESVTAAN